MLLKNASTKRKFLPKLIKVYRDKGYQADTCTAFLSL